MHACARVCVCACVRAYTREYDGPITELLCSTSTLDHESRGQSNLVWTPRLSTVPCLGLSTRDVQAAGTSQRQNDR